MDQATKSHGMLLLHLPSHLSLWITIAGSWEMPDLPEKVKVAFGGVLLMLLGLSESWILRLLELITLLAIVRKSRLLIHALLLFFPECIKRLMFLLMPPPNIYMALACQASAQF
jgi:hypothetical protein